MFCVSLKLISDHGHLIWQHYVNVTPIVLQLFCFNNSSQLFRTVETNCCNFKSQMFSDSLNKMS